MSYSVSYIIVTHLGDGAQEAYAAQLKSVFPPQTFQNCEIA